MLEVAFQGRGRAGDVNLTCNHLRCGQPYQQAQLLQPKYMKHPHQLTSAREPSAMVKSGSSPQALVTVPHNRSRRACAPTPSATSATSDKLSDSGIPSVARKHLSCKVHDVCSSIESHRGCFQLSLLVRGSYAHLQS